MIFTELITNKAIKIIRQGKSALLELTSEYKIKKYERHPRIIKRKTVSADTLKGFFPPA
jgi:hypothetical protein